MFIQPTNLVSTSIKDKKKSYSSSLLDCCSGGSVTWPCVWLVMLAREWLLGMMLSMVGGAFHLRVAQDWPWNN